MLLERIVAQAQVAPDKTAFIHNGVACSYAGFVQRIDQACAYFSQYRLPARSVVVLCVDQLAQAWVLGIALRQLGLVTLAIARAEEIEDLGLENISGLVTWVPEGRAGVARFARHGCRWIEVPRAFDAQVQPQPQPPELPRASPGGHIIQTSGTTGASKMILRDAAVEAATLDQHARINGIAAASIVYVRDFPLWTAGGYRWPLLSWHQGATVVFQQGEDFHVPLQSPALTHAFATPMTLLFVWRSPELPLLRNDGLRLLVTGGAMPRGLVQALQQRLTSQVYAVLASTEALTVCMTLVENLDELGWYQVHPSREVQVVDDADQPMPAGTVGLLRIRILDGVNGYLNDEAASRVFFREGWFYPGDLAMFRADGQLALCGRVTDVLNVLGTKIATAPLEAVLQNRLSVDAVCLLNVAMPGADEQVCAIIESRRELPPAELQAAGKELLAGLGPVRFLLFAELPRNRMGKVLRAALHRQVVARLAG